jgi:hypothetical protein
VGCVQSFVIQSNKQTGSGLEFYSSEKKIAPRVVTLEQEEIYGNNKTLAYDKEQGNY